MRFFEKRAWTESELTCLSYKVERVPKVPFPPSSLQIPLGSFTSSDSQPVRTDCALEWLKRDSELTGREGAGSFMLQKTEAQDKRCMDESQSPIIGTLRSNDADGNEDVKKNNRFNKQNNNFARASRFFVHFFARFCTTTTWKCLISRFMEDVNKQRRNFISLSELEYGPLKFSFRRVRLHLTK